MSSTHWSFFFSSRRRHTRCALVTGVQTCALPIFTADPGACAFQFDPVGNNKFERTGCDIAKAALAKAGVSYTSETRDRIAGEAAHVRIGERELIAPEPWRLAEEARAGAAEAFRRDQIGRAHV